jgi:hypothetical protein
MGKRVENESIVKSQDKLNAILFSGLPQVDGKGIIVGPSHSVRWEKAVDTGILPAPYADTRFIGEGGFPAWNRTIFTMVFRAHAVGRPIFFILPDYRFGNSITEQPDVIAGKFYDGFTHIRRDLIKQPNDALIYRHHVESLATWRQVFGRDLQMFNWTTLMTAAEHVTEGQYVEEGAYTYPPYHQWVAVDGPRVGAIDWAMKDIVKDGPRLVRMRVDRSLHPSPMGYFLLYHLLAGVSFADASKASDALWRKWCAVFIDEVTPLLRKTGPVHIGGQSAWLSMVPRLFFQMTRDKLAAAGLSFGGGDPVPNATIVKVTDELAFDDLGEGTVEKPHLLPWGAFARTIIAGRHSDNAQYAVPDIDRLRALRGKQADQPSWLDRALDQETPEQMVEAGADMSPTYAGVAMTILSVLTDLAHQKSHAKV